MTRVDSSDPETINDDEAGAIRRIVSMNRKTLAERNGITRRGQHPKHHGLVRACFHVLEDIPDHLHHGLFAKPVSFKALIRFSNGATDDDRKKDTHGLAIKLLDVPGRKLLPGREGELAHDFLLVDHPVFFTSTMEEYLIFNRHFTKLLDMRRNWRRGSGFLCRLCGAVVGLFMLLIFETPLLRQARAFSSARPSSPLASYYWSTTPYRLGPRTVVKYMARCVSPDTHDNSAPVSSKNGLAAALRQQLLDRDASFLFGVFEMEAGQSVEDATENWHTDAKRFVPLARIEIPNQDLMADGPYQIKAESMVFSPWMCLPAHRPLGAVNRARRDVYVEMAALRRQANAIGAPGKLVKGSW